MLLGRIYNRTVVVKRVFFSGVARGFHSNYNTIKCTGGVNPRVVLV